MSSTLQMVESNGSMLGRLCTVFKVEDFESVVPEIECREREREREKIFDALTKMTIELNVERTTLKSVLISTYNLPEYYARIKAMKVAQIDRNEHQEILYQLML